MKIHIIGCGATGAQWHGSGPSIGVNDCWKFGKPTTSLLLLNDKESFTPERLKIIMDSRPKMIYTHLRCWQDHESPNLRIRTQRYQRGEVHQDIIYHSKTSPFAAISLAHSLNFKEIILWGVDFVDHKMFRRGNPHYDLEILTYQLFINELKKRGVHVYPGCKGSTLDLPILPTD